MLNIILTTTRPEAFKTFSEALSSDHEVNLRLVQSGAEALEAGRAPSVHLIVFDADLPDGSPLDLVQKLLAINAMVNTVVVSPLSDEEFHEQSEGLGVLGRLPQLPGPSDATDLLHKLRRVIGYSS
jgi:DNA-binding response OmpR family regulator